VPTPDPPGLDDPVSEAGDRIAQDLKLEESTDPSERLRSTLRDLYQIQLAVVPDYQEAMRARTAKDDAVAGFWIAARSVPGAFANDPRVRIVAATTLAVLALHAAGVELSDVSSLVSSLYCD
jgi:hypothetical protein